MLQSVINALARFDRTGALARLHAGAEMARSVRDVDFASVLESLATRTDEAAPAVPAGGSEPQAADTCTDLRAEIRIGDVVAARVFNSGAWDVADAYRDLVAAARGGRFAAIRPGPELADQMIAHLAAVLEQFDVAIDWAPTAVTAAQWQERLIGP